MKKLFDVKKNKLQRIGLCILTIGFVAFTGIPVILWKQPLEYMVLLFFPYDLMILGIFLYYETWHISFFLDKMCKKVLFFKERTYYYSMIKDVYVNDRGLFVIKFTNGKKLFLHSDYENLEKAIKKIGLYHSIRF